MDDIKIKINVVRPESGFIQGANNEKEPSEKRKTTILLLCLFLGVLGVHRFYVGKIGTGILQFCTAGGLGIWIIIDLISIATGDFTDKEGKKILNW